MNLEQELIKLLEESKDEIISNMDSKGITASGRTAKALKVVVRGGNIMLIKEDGNNAPIETLEKGRPAGKVPYNFTEIILEWMKDKGLGDDKKMAGAIAWGKIRREGTDRHANPRNDIYSNVITLFYKKLRYKFPFIMAEMIKEGAKLK